MAFENGKYYCDRCGKKINDGQSLCKKCSEWLDVYLKSRKTFEHQKGGKE